MSLDKNLFTLNVRPIPGTQVVELVDPDGTIHYRKERVDGSGGLYQFNVFDPLSESLLASVSAPHATSKTKTVSLHNPSVPVELKFTGMLTFKWTFTWEEHEFEWKREECILIRKPDPPVLVAITKEPPGKLKTKTVQILDYNLNRFDINDRKGLEIVILSALLSFQDYSDAKSGEKDDQPTSSAGPSRTPMIVEEPPPPLPPKPQKSGAELIASMQTGELGEILVTEEGSTRDYAQYCANLLEGDNMLYTILKSSSPETVPKVLEIVHQTKRIRHKEGLDQELFQYVSYDTERPRDASGKKLPRVINLDNDNPDKYKPPDSIVVHLSKIVMPELQPKAKPKPKQKEKETVAKNGKSKVDKKRQQQEKEDEKLAKRLLEEEQRKAKKGKSKASPPREDDTRLSKKAASSPFPSNTRPPNVANFAAPVPRPPQSLGPPPYFPQHQRTASSPRIPVATAPYPTSTARPVSAFGALLGPPPPPPPQQGSRRSSSPNLMDSLVYKFRTIAR